MAETISIRGGEPKPVKNCALEKLGADLNKSLEDEGTKVSEDQKKWADLADFNNKFSEICRKGIKVGTDLNNFIHALTVYLEQKPARITPFHKILLSDALKLRALNNSSAKGISPKTIEKDYLEAAKTIESFASIENPVNAKKAIAAIDRGIDDDGVDRAYYLSKISLAETYLALGKSKEAYDLLKSMGSFKQDISSMKKDQNFTEADANNIISRIYSVQSDAVKNLALTVTDINEKQKLFGEAVILLKSLKETIQPGTIDFARMNVSLAEANLGANDPDSALKILLERGKNDKTVLIEIDNSASNQDYASRKNEYEDLYLRSRLCMAFSYINGGTYGFKEEEKKTPEKAKKAAYTKAGDLLEATINGKRPTLEYMWEFQNALGDLNLLKEDYTLAIAWYKKAADSIKAEEDDDKNNNYQKTKLYIPRLEILIKLARAYGERGRPTLVKLFTDKGDYNKSRDIYEQVTNEVLEKMIYLKKAIKKAPTNEDQSKLFDEYNSLQVFEKLVGREKIGRSYLLDSNYNAAISIFNDLNLIIQNYLGDSNAQIKEMVRLFRYQIHYDLANAYGSVGGEDTKRIKELQLAQQVDLAYKWPTIEEAMVRHNLYSSNFESANEGSKYKYSYTYQVTTPPAKTEEITKTVNVEINKQYTYTHKAHVGGHLSFYISETEDLTTSNDSGKKTSVSLKEINSAAELENKEGLIRVDAFFDENGKYTGFGVKGVKKFAKSNVEALVLYDSIDKTLETKVGGEYRFRKGFLVNGGVTIKDSGAMTDTGIYGKVTYDFGKFRGWALTASGSGGFYFNSQTGWLYAGINANKEQTNISANLITSMPDGGIGGGVNFSKQLTSNSSINAGVTINTNSYVAGHANLMTELDYHNLFGVLPIHATDLNVGVAGTQDGVYPAFGFGITIEPIHNSPVDNGVFLANAQIYPHGMIDARIGYERNKPSYTIKGELNTQSIVSGGYIQRFGNHIIGGPSTEDTFGWVYFDDDRLSENKYSIGFLKFFKISEEPLIYDENVKRSEFIIGPTLLGGFVLSPVALRKNPNAGKGTWLEDNSHYGERNHTPDGPIIIRQAVVRVFDEQKEKPIFEAIKNDLINLDKINIQFVIDQKVDLNNQDRIKGLRSLLNEMAGYKTANNPQFKLEDIINSIRIDRSNAVSFNNGQLSVGIDLIESAGKNKKEAIDKLKNEIKMKVESAWDKAKTTVISDNTLQELDLEEYFESFAKGKGKLVINNKRDQNDLKEGLKVLGALVERDSFILEGLRKIIVVDDLTARYEAASKSTELVVRKSLVNKLADEKTRPEAIKLLEAEFPNFDLRDGYLEFPNYKEPFGKRMVYELQNKRTAQYQLTATNLNTRREIVNQRDNHKLIIEFKYDVTEKLTKNSALEKFITGNNNKFKYDASLQSLVVTGRMTEQEKRDLLACVNKSEDIEAIERLFKQSQYNHFTVQKSINGEKNGQVPNGEVIIAVKIGRVSKSELSEITDNVEGLFKELVDQEYINSDGTMRSKFKHLKSEKEMKLSYQYAQKKEEIFKLLKSLQRYIFEDLEAKLTDIAKLMDPPDHEIFFAEQMIYADIINEFLTGVEMDPMVVN